MKWEIFHVLGKPPSSFHQSTVDVLASTIEPKLANILVRKLNQVCPLEDLRHVKRVRRRSSEGNIELSVILCLANGHDNCLEGLPEDLLQLINVYQLNLFKAKVSEFAALSREEWEEQCKLWPTSYHPPNNDDGIVGFGNDELQLIFNYMKLAVRLSKLSHKVVNTAVIVDPLSRQIIASASDETFQGATCVSNTFPECIRSNELSATSLSSQSNADGSVNCKKNSVLSPEDSSQLYVEVSCLYPWGWPTQGQHNDNSLLNCKCNNSWHPLRHAALVAIEKAAARDRQLFPGSGLLEHWSQLIDSSQDTSFSSVVKRQKTHSLDLSLLQNDGILGKCEHASGLPSESTRPYLCTGYDIYLVWEPCAMCAMGLVHQRIRRIFYAFPNSNAGALGSVYRLQGEKSLNHHYSVFRILLPERTLQEVDLNSSDSPS